MNYEAQLIVERQKAEKLRAALLRLVVRWERDAERSGGQAQPLAQGVLRLCAKDLRTLVERET